MDSRGYGRTGSATRTSRRLTAALLLAGLAGLCIGAYGLTAANLPPALGTTGFAAGTAACVAGLVLGGRRVARSHYRPDPWQWPEWAVTAAGVACAAGLWAGAIQHPAAVNPAMYPLQWPPLPLIPAVAILTAALAAVAAPPPAAQQRGTAGPEPVPAARALAGARQ